MMVIMCAAGVQNRSLCELCNLPLGKVVVRKEKTLITQFRWVLVFGPTAHRQVYYDCIIATKNERNRLDDVIDS